MHTRQALWTSAFLLLGLAACDDGSTDPPVDPNQPAQVEIQGEDFRLLVGNSRSLSAEVRTAQGTVLSVPPQWVSGNASVVTVNGAGVVEAMGAGEAQLFASAGLGQDSIGVSVPLPSGAMSSAGGVILTPDGLVRLDVPANAISAALQISIVAALADSLPSGSTILAGTAFEFGPRGLTFAAPATLSIQYDRSLTNTLEARRLRLHQLAGATWTPVPGSTVDTATAQASGEVSSFSIYAVAPIPNQAPTATISAPADGSEVASGLPVTFAGTGTDPDDGTLSDASLVWSSSVDGELGTGTTVVRSDLTMGAHVVTLTATDGEGATGTAQVSLTVVDGPPVVEIAEPSKDTVVKFGDAVVLRGAATDHVDGAISGDSLSWSSDLDGALGTGDSISVSSLSLGDHVITLSAPDSQGSEGVATVAVSVQSNEPPVVTITSPSSGASVGDRSGTTFQGTAEDPEDGALSGAALVWTSSVDGTLGTGTSTGSGSLTIGTHLITLTATDSNGATGSATISITVFDEPPPLLFPQLTFVSEAAGALTFSVANSTSYDPELFVLDNTLPACGADPNGGRTWVEVFDGNGTLLHTFCDYDDRADMASMTFTPATPPAQVYIELWDRRESRRVRSGSVTPVPTAGSSIHGVVANDRDLDLNTIDPGEALAGVTIQLIVDTNADGVIDAGESVWATTVTNGDGAYSFTDLWQRNYIVRAVSPSNATVLRALSAAGAVVDQTGTLLTTAVVGAGATLNQSGTIQVGTTAPPSQGDELPRWSYLLGTAVADSGLEPSGPGPNSMNAALTTAPAHFVFLYNDGSISGTVTAGGSGVAGARVIVTRCQTAPAAPSPPAAGACTLKHGVPSPHISNIDTDANGGYSVSGLLEGVYQIEVAPLTAGYSTVVTPAGGTYLALVEGSGGRADVPDFVIN